MVRRVSQQLDEGADLQDDDRDTPAQGDGDEDLELEAGPEDEDEEEDDESPEGVEDDELPAGDEPLAEPVRQARRPVARPAGGRGDRQFGELRQQLQRTNDELAALRAQQTQPRQESPQVRQARLAALSDTERMEFLLNETREEMRTQREVDRFNASDAADRARFDAIAQANPRYKKHAAEVERRLNLARQNGQNVPRETVLTYILGERMRAGLDSPQVQRQKSQAKDRVAREKAALPRGRGERGSSRTETERAARDRRLENVQI